MWFLWDSNPELFASQVGVLTTTLWNWHVWSYLYIYLSYISIYKKNIISLSLYIYVYIERERDVCVCAKWYVLCYSQNCQSNLCCFCLSGLLDNRPAPFLLLSVLLKDRWDLHCSAVQCCPPLHLWQKNNRVNISRWQTWCNMSFSLVKYEQREKKAVK